MNIFKLKYPVRVKYVKSLKWGKSPCWGIYEWNSGKKIHVIKVDSSLTGQELLNTIAHEYIHAWQCENGLKLSHGRVFKWWAEVLKEQGFVVSKYQ